MNHRQTVQAVARRLPHLQRHTVAEVLEVVAEVWAEELAQPEGRVTLINLGKLQIEAQQMRVGGAVRDRLEAEHGIAPTTIRRLYYRFRPSGWLRQKVEEKYEQT
ncbi:MAG: HU family DNA-binding protein [Aggregatilineales bacterium]